MEKEKLHEYLEKYFSDLPQIKVRRRELLIPIRQQPQAVYWLRQGIARMYESFPDGMEITYNLFKPGSVFPLSWAIAGLPNQYGYQMITAGVLTRIPSERFRKLMDDRPELMTQMSIRLIKGMDNLLNQVGLLVTGSARQKLAAVLLMLARRFGEDVVLGGQGILPLTHQDLAFMSGLTRETVSAEMRGLRQLGSVFGSSRRLRLNIPSLKDVAGE